MYEKVESSLESVLVKSDENKLMPSRNTTVSPVALMRLGLFLPFDNEKERTQKISVLMRWQTKLRVGKSRRRL